LAIAILVFVAGGCVRTIQPILKDDQAVLDNSIVGKWVNEKGKQVCDVQPAHNDNVYTLLYTGKDGKAATFLLRIGKVGDLMIAEIRPAGAPGPSDARRLYLLPLYTFSVIQQTSPKAVLQVMDADWLKKYLDEHPGELQTANLGHGDFVVTSSTEEFQAFLLRHCKDKGIFGEPAALVRPGDPTTRHAATAP